MFLKIKVTDDQKKLHYCLAGGSPNENLTPIFWFQKNLFFLDIMVTCDQQEKVLSSPKVVL